MVGGTNTITGMGFQFGEKNIAKKPEIKKKISDSLKKYKRTKIHQQHLVNSMRRNGKFKKTEIHKIRISETMKKLFKEGKLIPPKTIFKKGHHSFTEFTKERWQNQEYRGNQIKAILKGSFKRPTNLEDNFLNFFQKFNIPLNYVGNGAVLIGDEKKNPDFIESNGKKICIEVGNKVEKSIKRKGRNYQSWQEYERQRIEYFAKFGWKCLVLWDDGLKNETKLLEKLKHFRGERIETTQHSG